MLATTTLFSLPARTTATVRPSPPTAAEMAFVLAAGVRAPSGDNSQPWDLRARGAEIEVRFDGERSRCGAFGHAAGMMAVGGLLESLEIAAASLGLRTLAARTGAGVATFLVRVVREPGHGADLAGALFDRCTNRSAYEKTPLPWGTLEAIASEGEPDARVLVTSDPERRTSVASAAGLAERVRFDEVPMGDFHRWLRFSRKHAEASRDGLDVRLLGLDAVETMALRISGSRLGLGALRLVGATALAGRRAELEILASGGLGLVTAASSTSGALTDDAFVESGRVMLRAWLRATRLGLAFGPAAAATLVPLSRHLGATFRPRSEAALDAVDRTLRAAFEVPAGHHPVLLFRLGAQASSPELRSERRAFGVSE